MALIPVEEARARILDKVKPLPSEEITLDKALGRVLAKPVGRDLGADPGQIGGEIRPHLRPALAGMDVAAVGEVYPAAEIH